jgi:cellulase/cellobiase CelA1
VLQWHGGFLGEFTITNKGSAAINGWELSAVLPGDQIDSVWDALHHTSGDTLIMDPQTFQATIEPGTSLTEHFTAQGTSTSPTSCTFNGAAC